MTFLKRIVVLFLSLCVLSLFSGCNFNKSSGITKNSQTENSNLQLASENKDSDNKNAIKNNSSSLKIPKKVYTDETFKFSVTFPEGWGSKNEPSHEDSIDGGINIYIDNNKNDRIFVFGQKGHISVPNNEFKKEKFVAQDGLLGDLLTSISNNKVELYLILNDGFHGAVVNCSTKSYNHNENQILDILKSIRILD